MPGLLLNWAGPVLRPPLLPIAKGGLLAVGLFALLGTVSALWPNPFFVRMTPAGGWEVAALLLTALLSGIFVAIRRAECSVVAAQGGGVLGFLGVACPTCNKVLMLIFGGELLMAWYEPVRVYVAAAGVLVLAVLVAREWLLRSGPALPMTLVRKP